jgi:Na+-transporting NADH:ubiquinone oxidoreductase subunit NqrF
VTEHLIPSRVAELNSFENTEFYICGSPVMVTEVRSMLQMYGISDDKVFFEQY